LLSILGVAVAAVLALVIWLWLVRRAWVRATQSLAVGPPAGVVGAWIWTTLRFRAYRMTLPPQLSPDRVARGDPIHEVPPDTAEPLRQLGLLVAPVAFGAPNAVADDDDVATAWRLARSACGAAESSLGTLRRLRLRFVSPGAFELHLGN
jgi:HAMP domain-containing protein